MFGNIIYFIIALMIYASYHQPLYDAGQSPFKVAFFSFSLVLFFFILNKFFFLKLERTILKGNIIGLDTRFARIVTCQSIVAIVIFVVNIYCLNLLLYTEKFFLFSIFPSIEALLFFLLFLFYFFIIWSCAYKSHGMLHGSEVSWGSYIWSNISLSVPVILPWFIFSVLLDIVNILPFNFLKQFLGTREGGVIFFLVFLIFFSIFGPALILKIWRCRPLEHGYYRERITELCKKAGFECAGIYYWSIFDGKMITAGVMGLTKKCRYILVTESLLSLLTPEETDAVIAHEIGHVKNKHILFYLFFLIGYILFLYVISDIILYVLFESESLFYLMDGPFQNQSAINSIIYSILVVIMFIVWFRYFFGYFMRNCERQADAYVFKMFGSARPLISTFVKIAKFSRDSWDKPSWHHFSIRERVDFLEKCERNMEWITLHDRKIKRIIVAYAFFILLVGLTGYQLNFGTKGRVLKDNVIENILHNRLDKNYDDFVFYAAMGDWYLNKKRYENAIKSYKKSLSLNMDNPGALNNLAWLYATCDDDRLRDPEEAVFLAKRALGLLTAPYILDTLAESYYACSLFGKAIETAKNAAQLAEKNDKAYYEKQLKKFIKATNP